MSEFGVRSSELGVPEDERPRSEDEASSPEVARPSSEGAPAQGEAVSLDREYGHPYAFWAQIGCGLPTGLALARTHEYEVRKALGQEAKPRESPDLSYDDPKFVAKLPHQDEGLLYTMVAGLL